jgi:hypothetical protein
MAQWRPGVASSTTMQWGGVDYRAEVQGNNLVYVVQQP